MKLIPMVRLTKAETKMLSEAFIIYHLLPISQYAELQVLSNMLHSTLDYDEGRVEKLQSAFFALYQVVEKDTTIEASPQMVADSERMIAEGKVPLLLNPTEMADLIRGARIQQLARIREAIVFLGQVESIFTLAKSSCRSKCTEDYDIQTEA